MEDTELRKICEYMVQTAREASNLILSAQPASIAASTKKNTTDIVTETDRAVEKFIHRRLTEQYATFKFIGEETYKAGVAITDQPTFIVDLIDGTSNFTHGFPEVCISIGLVVKKQPTIGVVYNPYQKELWKPVKGHGAYYSRNSGEQQTLPLVSALLQGLRSACIALEWGSDREGPSFDLNLKVFTTLARTPATGGRLVNSLRFTGSAAIAISRVAAGQQDAFWECGCWVWDVVAAWCILTESGGLVVDGHPGEWNPPIDNRRYLAVRPATSGQKEFIDEFWSVIGNDTSTYRPSD